MKSIKTKVMALLLVVVMALTGCSGDYATTINSDGSGKMVMSINMEKEAYDKMLATMGITNSTAYFKSHGINDISTVKIDGVEYYQTKETVTAKKGKLSSTLTFQMGTDVYATADTIYFKISSDKDSLEEIAYYKEMGMNVNSVKSTFSFEFSKPIVSTTGKIDTSNPNKVTYSINMETAGIEVFATTKAGVTLASTKAKIKKLNTVKKSKIKKLSVIKKGQTAKKANVSVKLKKVKSVKGYEIQYSTKKKFTRKTTNVKYAKKTKVILKGLKKGKKYYVRVRAYKTNFAGSEIYSKYAKKAIKIGK